MAHHSLPEQEVGAAAAIYPNHSVVVAPTGALDAWCVAPLASQADPAAGVRGAFGSTIAVRRAGQSLLAATPAVGPHDAGREHVRGILDRPKSGCRSGRPSSRPSCIWSSSIDARARRRCACRRVHVLRPPPYESQVTVPASAGAVAMASMIANAGTDACEGV